MRKAFQYRAYLNKKTQANCLQWLNLCRFLYNSALEQRITAYKHGVNISKYSQSKELPETKKQLPEFKQVGSQCLQDVIERLDKAYQAFFRRIKLGEKPGFPRFKGKHRYNSFTLKQHGWKLEGKHLIIKNIGRFKLRLHRPIEGNIKTVTVKRTPTGKWFVAFSCNGVPERKLSKTNKAVGIDVGLKHFLTDSDGHVVESKQHFRKSEKLLRRRQRKLSRRKRGSKRRNKARKLVAQIHEKISNQRKDFLHKTANYYIQRYDTICIENLSIKNMVRSRYLAKSISDSGWGIFFGFLSYKAEEAGRIIIKVDPSYTSQKCSGCGKIVKKSLSTRTHCCTHCGLILDRDYNAALNILRAGQARRALTPTVGVA